MKVLSQDHSNRKSVATKAGLSVALFFTGGAQAEDNSRFQLPLGFELETATLADVQEALGSAEEFEIPDSHHQFGVCFFTKDSGEIFDWPRIWRPGKTPTRSDYSQGKHWFISLLGIDARIICA